MVHRKHSERRGEGREGGGMQREVEDREGERKGRRSEEGNGI